MFEGIYAAATGMDAQQQELSAIGNDLANSSTNGYKAERVGFRDLLYSQVRMAGTNTDTGAGAAAQSIGRSQAEGSLRQTGNPLNVAIQGEGFFTVRRADGTTGLTRDGGFQVNANRQLVTAAGDFVQPPITIPRGVAPSDVSIGPDGTVRAGTRTLGRLSVVTVTSPDHLLEAGDNLLSATAESGAPQRVANPSLKAGAVEASNVNVGDELVQMANTQRSYQLESTAIQNESQMMSMANQLRS